MAEVIPNNFPWHMPCEAREVIMAWSPKTKSPFGHSYYDLNEGEKTWEITPLDSHRISDHWNFSSQGKTHCPTDVLVSNAEWALGKWDGERYIVVKVFGRRPIRETSDKEARGMSPRLQKKRRIAIEKQEKRAECTKA